MNKYIPSLIWFLSLLVAFILLLKYSITPGEAAIQSKWPVNSSLKRDESLPTLVIFLHADCPCSKASVSELEKITVLFYKPQFETDQSVKDSSLWKRLLDTRANLLIDNDGVESKLFNSKTSGQTFLFSPEGSMIFSGGITESRGHEGESIGEDIILQYVNNRESIKNKLTAFVFGCSLPNPERRVAQ
jgi:hypothetical protein